MDREYCVNFEPYENEELRTLITSHCRQEMIPEGIYFVKPGQKISEITYILEGKSAHTMFNSDGKEKISYILTSGRFLAEGLFASGYNISIAERYSYSLTPLRVCKIGKKEYDKLICLPVFRDAIILNLNIKRGFLQRELESAALEQAKERLKRFLILLCDPSASTDGVWYPLSHDYTHQTIASIVGTNRVTISRFISELAQDGFLRVINKHIQINKAHMTDI